MPLQNAVVGLLAKHHYRMYRRIGQLGDPEWTWRTRNTPMGKLDTPLRASPRLQGNHALVGRLGMDSDSSIRRSMRTTLDSR